MSNEIKKKFNYEIYTYEKILAGELKTFSPYFFNIRYRKKRLQTLIRYLIEEKLNITPEEALSQLSLEIIKKYKLKSILRYIEKPVELEKDDLSYLVYYAYPNRLSTPTQEELTIEYYKKVLSGEKRNFPKNYFLEGLHGEERAAICVRYLCEEVLNIPKDRIPQELTVDVLRDYKLKILLTAIYFSIHDLITNVYPNEFSFEDFDIY